MAIRRLKRAHGIDTSKAEASVAAALDRIVDSYANRLKTAAKTAAVSIRREAIVDWYSYNKLSSGHAVAKAVVGKATFKRVTNRKTIIEVSTYMDAERLAALSDHYPSAERWIERHEDINSPWAPGLYVYTLRWEAGVLYLPERAHFTGSGWTNSNFQISCEDTLRKFTLKRLNDFLDKDIIVSKLRSRNTNMGAGITSLGRDNGLANLNKHRSKRW